jgi:glutamate decarboxylase
MVGTEETSQRTAAMAKAMISKGWMIDFAPGAKGKFFRVVVNISTLPSSVVGLVEALKTVGKEHLPSQ